MARISSSLRMSWGFRHPRSRNQKARRNAVADIFRRRSTRTWSRSLASNSNSTHEPR